MTQKKSRAKPKSRSARAPLTGVNDLLKGLVRSVTDSAGAQAKFSKALNRVARDGMTLDDVAAVNLARLVLVEHLVNHDGISAAKALTELGSVGRELKDLAEAYREAGRTLPDEVVFALDLRDDQVRPGGEVPDGAPELATDELVGDIIEAG